MNNCHPTFKLLRQQEISSLNVTVNIYEHNKTGAQHIHLAANNSENVFLVGFRTVPLDSTGVAHILEHTSLCGSKRYPVRDPFFMMIRRSLNTFMNAFTANDWTAYPFASKNRKDFDNLLGVYLDATFFARLDPLDFAQEGHRIELSEPDNLDSELVYKGVVFNEMKGAMSSPVSLLFDAVSRYLNPTTTYHYNSGGAPTDIPDLTYEQLIDFYKTHYHPSNAIFMTYGDIPPNELQEKFETLALKDFEQAPEKIFVPPEKRYFAPLNVEEHYPLDKETPLEQNTHHVLCWLLGDGGDLKHQLETKLMSNVLLMDSASPLQQALETFPGAKATSPIAGLENEHRELSFYCGVEGSEPEQAAAFEQCVIDTLQKIVDEGVEQSKIESVLHQLELHQREITGDRYPYGLQLVLGALPGAIHRNDPIALLDLDPAIEQLREAIKDRQYIPNLIKTLLLDNPHRLRLTMKPDHQLSDRRDAAEKARLAEIKASMNEADLKGLAELASTLKERQEEKDDISILPKVELSDIPKEIEFPEPDADSKVVSSSKWPITRFSRGTNGITYQQIVLEMPQLSEAEISLLPFYALCLPEIGCDGKDYLATQAWQSSVTGGVGASYSFVNSVTDKNQMYNYITVSGRALNRNNAALAEILHATLERVKFNEPTRIKELIGQKRAGMERSVTGNGHGLAMLAASSGLSPTSKIRNRLSGLQGIQATKKLSEQIESDEALDQLLQDLTALHQKLLNTPREFLLICEQEQGDAFTNAVCDRWSQFTAQGSQETHNAAPFSSTQTNQVWLANTQVNFCAKAYECVSKNHADAAALSILAPYLRNGYLHRTIREQGGAYGGGASYVPSTGTFRFYSYRDPRFVETLADFDESVQWLLNEKQDPEHLEQAILGQISSFDKPGSPAGEAKQVFHNRFSGQTNDFLREYRSRLLQVTVEDLKRVAEQYLTKNASTAVVSQRDLWNEAKESISLEEITM